MSRYLNHLLPKLNMSKLDDDCPVCSTHIKMPVIMPCGHIICRSCGGMVESCPICRLRLPEHSIVVSTELVAQLHDQYFTYESEAPIKPLTRMMATLQCRTYATKTLLLRAIIDEYHSSVRLSNKADSMAWQCRFMCSLSELLWDGTMPDFPFADASTQTDNVTSVDVVDAGDANNKRKRTHI